jgi:mannosyltransferase
MNPADTQKSRHSDDGINGRRIIDLAILCLITAAAAALRFHALGERSLWFDEGISFGIARLSWANFARLLWEREANMSLYYFLLRIWLWFGGSEFFLRALSALIGTATVPLIYIFGRRAFNSRVGLIAAGLLAANAYHIRYSQEARGYAVAAFMAMLSAVLFAGFVKSGGERGGIAWAAVSALLVYSHFYAALFILAQAISLLVAKPVNFNWKNTYRPARWFLYFTFPLIAFLFAHGASQLSWIPPISLSGISSFFYLYLGLRGWPLEIIFAAAALVAAWAYRYSWATSRFSLETWAQGLIWVWFAIPFGLVVLLSLWKNLFIARYLFFCLPALMLVAAVGLSKIRIPSVLFLVLVVFSVLSTGGILRFYAQDIDVWRDDWRMASKSLLSSARPDDGVIFYPGPGRMSYEFYKSLSHSAAPPRVISPAHAPNGSPELSDKDFLVPPLAEVIENLPEDAPRLWLFAEATENRFSGDMSINFLKKWCEKRYHLVEMRTFDGIELILYSK